MREKFTWYTILALMLFLVGITTHLSAATEAEYKELTTKLHRLHTLLKSPRTGGSGAYIVPCSTAEPVVRAGDGSCDLTEIQALISAINHSIDEINDSIGAPTDVIDCDFVMSLSTCDEINAIDNFTLFQWMKAIMLKIK